VDEVKEILSEEEVSFAKTLDRGEKLFEQCLNKAKESGSKMIDGKDAFRLYDTYGFPIDLTRLMADENGFAVDEETFLTVQQAAKDISRAKKNKTADDAVKLDVHLISELEKSLKLPKTNDNYKYGTR
jgi:alanyl-tRNA synthetase